MANKNALRNGLEKLCTPELLFFTATESAGTIELNLSNFLGFYVLLGATVTVKNSQGDRFAVRFTATEVQGSGGQLGVTPNFAGPYEVTVLGQGLSDNGCACPPKAEFTIEAGQTVTVNQYAKEFPALQVLVEDGNSSDSFVAGSFEPFNSEVYINQNTPTIPEGDTVTRKIKIKNVGQGYLYIFGLQFGGDATFTPFTAVPILLSEGEELLITTFTLDTVAAGNKIVSVEFTGVNAPLGTLKTALIQYKVV